MLFRKIYIINIYNVILFISEQYTKHFSLKNSIYRCCQNNCFLYMSIRLLYYANDWSHATLALGLGIRNMIFALKIYSKSFSRLYWYTLFTWFFVFTIIIKLLNKILKTLIQLIFSTKFTALVIWMLAFRLLLLNFILIALHAFQAFHIDRMDTLILAWLAFCLLLHFFNFKLLS